MFVSVRPRLSGVLSRPARASPFPAATAFSRIRTFSSSVHNEEIRRSTQPRNEDTTDFGFQTIDRSSKDSRVRGVFDSVASSYDTMNDVMSFGIHRLWKDHFVRRLNPGRRAGGSSPMNILDLAGGTGDIAFRMLDHSRTVNGDWETRVTVCDINEEMLNEGRRRALSLGYSEDDPCLSFLVQNGEDLEAIADDSVDLVTIAFGIRNFTNKEKALRTAHRVLKRGGVFSCLEFSRVNYPILSSLYTRYSFSLIPMMGQLVAGDRDSYQYLVESIANFPCQEDFAAMVKNAGFRPAGNGWEDLSFGVAAIHTGVKV